MEANGQIRCSGSFAQCWIKKYFPPSQSPDKLPVEVRRWLRKALVRSRTLQAKTDGDRLVISLVPGDPKGPHCLLFEEHTAWSFTRKPLTRREAEVLFWVAQGKANWAIGKILKLSPATVRKHLQNIYTKLGVENRTAAALCTLENLQSVNLDLGGQL